MLRDSFECRAVPPQPELQTNMQIKQLIEIQQQQKLAVGPTNQGGTSGGGGPKTATFNLVNFGI